jgi:phosphatidylglycerophosphatase A
VRSTPLNLFGLGRLPFSASVASAIALAVYLAVSRSVSNAVYVNGAVVVALVVLGVVELGRNREYAEQDPKEIVIDEFAGMYAGLLVARPDSLAAAGLFFVLFRVFDLVKVVRFAQFESGPARPYAVLADDLAIGVLLGAAFAAAELLA